MSSFSSSKCILLPCNAPRHVGAWWDNDDAFTQAEKREKYENEKYSIRVRVYLELYEDLRHFDMTFLSALYYVGATCTELTLTQM